MSTVNKDIADRIIAGEFPEDEVKAIIRYENAFNGNYAYKLVYENQMSSTYLSYLLHKCENLIDAQIYWNDPKYIIITA